MTTGPESAKKETALAVSETVSSNYHLPQAWAEFLAPFPWDWYIHLVPDNYPHPESLQKLFKTGIHHLNRRIYGQNYWKDKNKGVLTAIGWEHGEQTGHPHGHGLIGGIPDYISKYQFYWWLESHGARFTKIVPYKKEAGAEYYMSKSTYAWKRGEIDVSQTLSAYQRGSWRSGKVAHEQYCREKTFTLRYPLSAYSW